MSILFDSYNPKCTPEVEEKLKLRCSICGRKIKTGEPYWTKKQITGLSGEVTLYLCSTCADKIAKENAPTGV